MLIASAVVLVVALIGLVVGLRGRRIDDHPRCRKCGFDVVGLYPAAVMCPECGRGLGRSAGGGSDERASGGSSEHVSGGSRERFGGGGRSGVRIGNRRRRRGLIALSAVCVVVSLVMGGLAAWGSSAGGAGLAARKPAWWLILDARSGNLLTQDRALKELVKRRDQKRLTEEQFLRLVREGLVIQADERRVWNRAWGDFIEVAWIDGLLTAEQRRAYAAHAYTVGVKAREVVRRGDRVPASVEVTMRAGSGPFLVFEVVLDEMSIGGQKLLSMPFFAAGSLDGGSRSTQLSPHGLWSSDYYEVSERDEDAPVSVQPGSYELTTRWKLRVGVLNDMPDWSTGVGRIGWTYGRRHGLRSEVESAEGERELVITTPVRIVEAGTETVELVKDERLGEAMRRAVSARIDDGAQGTIFQPVGRYMGIDIVDPPIDVAFDITVRGPSREDHGRVVKVAAKDWLGRLMGGHDRILLEGGEEEGPYEITLTPSVELARATTGITRIWGEPIVLKGIRPVGWVDPGQMSTQAFWIAAALKLPAGHLAPSNHAFRSVALRMPYVYVGDRLGDLYIFKVGEEDRKASKDPVAILERVGDGNDLKVVGDVLLCTKFGGLAAYSLKDAERPERLVEVGTDQQYHGASLVVEGTRALVLGQGRVVAYDISEPGSPRLVSVMKAPGWTWSGCIEGDYLYAVEMSDGSGGEGSGLGVYDISDLSQIRRVGSVGMMEYGCAVHAIGSGRLVVTLDPQNTMIGNVAFVGVSDPVNPVVEETRTGGGGRVSAMMRVDEAYYLINSRGIMQVEAYGLETVLSIGMVGSNTDTGPYHGDARDGWAALPMDGVVVVVRKRATNGPDGPR